MPTSLATTSPFLDEAFYAMVASHFPAMESTATNVVPTPAPLSVAVLSSAQSARPGLATGDGTFSSACSQPAIATDGPSTSMTSKNYQAEAGPSKTLDIGGHRAATSSIYHPQPTRSGRIPVPPPEEELQAMLAMDNYFEFPSESESDDDDFLPASELNDDDDEQEDDTPRNEAVSGLGAIATMGDLDDMSSAVIPSAEYDWLMDNLNAMERTAHSQSPSGYPLGEASSASNLAREQSSTQITEDFSPKSPAAQPFRRLDGVQQPVVESAVRKTSASFPQSTETHQDHVRTSSAASSVSTPILGPHTVSKESRPSNQPRRGHEVAQLKSASAAGTSLKKPRASTARKRRAGDSLDDAAISISDDLSSAAVDPSLSKVESKRKRNAEQSRTFRERQRARKEETSARIEELEDENEHLRQELSALKQRLRHLEGTGRSGSKSTRDADLDETVSRVAAAQRTKPPSKKASANHARRAASPEPPETLRQMSQAPVGALSFEDLGKFVAGFVQAKSQNSNTERTPTLPQELNGQYQPPQTDSSDTQHPLLLLTQLLASQHQL